MHLEYKDTDSWKGKGQKKICHVSSNLKIAGMAILISDEIGLKTKNTIICWRGNNFPLPS